MSTEPRHLDDETLVRWACNELGAAEQARVTAHLDDCDECREIWQAVDSVRRAAVGFDPGAIAPIDARFVRPPRPHRLWLGAAASAVLAVALLFVARSMQGPDQAPVPDPVVRSVPQQVPEPLSPAEGARIPAATFSWRGVDGATRYSLDLLDARGDLIWTSDRGADLEAGWPAAVEATPGRYFWRVSAHFDDGEEPTASPLVSFDLIAP